MKRRSWVLVISVLLAALVLGCNMTSMGPGAQQAQTPTPTPTATAEKPLDASAWPTPQPAEVLVSPTPFPKVTLAPTATRAIAAAATPTAQSAGGKQLAFTGNPQELAQQVVTLSGGFTPVGAATVTRDAVEVRQGPGESFPVAGSARLGELAAILGKNAAGDWLYVLTQSVVQGWLPASALQQTFALGEPPVLADDPPREKRAGSTQPSAASETGLSQLLNEISPVASGVVTADGLAARQGPGDSYPAAAAVAQGELLGIFGTNAGGDWVYIVTISGTLGWVPRDAVRVMGSLDGAPVLPANPLALAAAEPAQAAASPGPTTPPPSVTDLPAVATATVNNAQLNLRQGPGPNYQVLATLKRGDALSVLALNMARDWALVASGDGLRGWVYLDYLSVGGSLAEAPLVRAVAPDAELPADGVVPIISASVPGSGPTPAAPAPPPPVSTRERPAAPPPTAAPPQVPVLAGLSPIATARPSGDEATLYRGPGSTYEPIVTLRRDESASVLAVGRGAVGWVLVQPPDRSPGWGMLSELTIDGALDSAPQVTTAWVKSNEVPVRSGPGIAYPRGGTLAINTLVSVLGVDKSRGWALVAPLQGAGAGWVPLNLVTLGGSWADQPELPATALAAPTPVAAAAPAAVQPAAAPANRLAIQLSSGGDIMLIDADGSGLRRLTNGIDPALSPDASQVAFTRWNGVDGSLWVINVDGSGERLVMDATKQAKHPAWSPDGSRLVVNYQHGGRLDEYQECKNLIELGDRMPPIPWNVDSDTVEVKMRNGIPFLCWQLPPDPHWRLRVVNSADGAALDVPSDTYAFAPEWDPANNWRIVSSGVNGLVQLDANRQVQWALTDRREDHTPAFAPDGRYVAVAYNQNGGYDIHRLNADGSGRVRLTQTPLWVTSAPGGARQWNHVAPAWSPDGSRIAFLTDRAGRWEIWVMNWDGSNPQPMFSAETNARLPIRYDFVDERVFTWR